MSTPRERGSGRRGPGGRGGRPPRRSVEVTSVREVTPNLVRVVASGELEGWNDGGPGAHFKVFLPVAGEVVMRTYTVRDFDREAGLLTIDFGLHADGPVTAWARTAAVGDRFAVAGEARPGYVPSAGARWCLFFADHCALPAVASVLDALPADMRAIVFVEVTDPADETEFRSAAEVQATWLPESGPPCAALLAAARSVVLPEGPGEVWIGCEAGAMRGIRRHALGELGLPREALHSRAYWKESVPNHSDHDTGSDDG
ncbi:NADPH-dependent ferric siderophore reductase, contains FAD-binding and SIP domains [Streptomyces sp. LamerLS-316]|nr:NADPH-dependent ferric siderophore reductase, contains FAD-binding and SIP domains [Streptomyces sp. LamerLS-316]